MTVYRLAEAALRYRSRDSQVLFVPIRSFIESSSNVHFPVQDFATPGRRQSSCPGLDTIRDSPHRGRTWELREHQVAQVLCAAPAQRPAAVTITAGANDFFRGDVDVVAGE